MTGKGKRDLGNNVSVSMHTCRHRDDWSGCIVEFHDMTPSCDGAISWCSECSGQAWNLISLEPLHVEPSVACREHPHHHGFIRDGKWIPA